MFGLEDKKKEDLVEPVREIPNMFLDPALMPSVTNKSIE